MGYNTTVIIMNDAIGQLADPVKGAAFAQELLRASTTPLRSGEAERVPLGNYYNGAYVLSCKHADNITLLAVGGNFGTEIGSLYDAGFKHTKEAALEAAATILRQAGWRVSPPKEKKA